MEVRNQRLKAHHQSPDTELRPRAVAASWTLTYALLVEGKWYGDLTANCDVHGIRPVQIGKLAAVTHDAGNLGKLKTVLF